MDLKPIVSKHFNLYLDRFKKPFGFFPYITTQSDKEYQLQERYRTLIKDYFIPTEGVKLKHYVTTTLTMIEEANQLYATENPYFFSKISTSPLALALSGTLHELAAESGVIKAIMDELNQQQAA